MRLCFRNVAALVWLIKFMRARLFLNKLGMSTMTEHKTYRQSETVLDETRKLHESFDNLIAEIDRATKYLRILTATSVVTSIIIILV